MQLGSTVKLTYTGKLEDGTVFGFANADEPMEFQTGMDMVIDGLEEAILEMNEVGEKKTVVIDQYKAYGEYLDEYTQWIPEEQIPVRNLEVGKRVWLASSDDGAPMPATVIEVKDGLVNFDLNHPLAGHDLTFEIEILDIQDAPENFVSAAAKAEHLRQQSKLLGGDQGNDYR
jgi:peptidylprolyl isomerase